MKLFNDLIKRNSDCPICTLQADLVAEMPNFPVTEIYKKYNTKDDYGQLCPHQSLFFCDKCQHLFLGSHLPRNFIYTNYVTESSTSEGAQIALNHFYDFVMSRSLGAVDGIIDIGANDTFLLERFVGNGAKLIGIDPNISSSNPEIHCIKGFVEDCELNSLVNGKRIFLCSHTLEHIYDPRSFLSQIASILQEEDDFFLQFPSFELLIRDARFDQVHHQHLNYFSLFSLRKLLTEFGLIITAHKYDDDHYGALMCHVRKDGAASLPTVKNVDIESVRFSHSVFLSSMRAADDRILLLGDQFYCFGASLMLPLLSYYLPSLKNARAILDASNKKHGLTYINFEREIISDEGIDYPSSDFVVTAVSTKAATRRVARVLIDRDSRNIVFPLNTL
jgi:hypothetical protein